MFQYTPPTPLGLRTGTFLRREYTHMGDKTCRTCKFHSDGLCTVELPPWLMEQAKYLNKATWSDATCDLHKPKDA